MNILNLKDMNIKQINEILDLAKEFEKGKKVNYQGEKIIANLFFEPSTRTHYSFDTAELRLGCKTLDFDVDNSSLKKGETLYDTVKTFEAFGIDAIVIRHKKDKYYNELVGKIKIPIINGGDGVSSHPSQSLLDLYTIKKEFGKFKGLNIAIVGDIKHSRVAHTNIEIMKRLGMNVYISGPEEFKENKYNYKKLDELIDKMDIIMLLRVQFERHSETLKIENKKEYTKYYGLNKKRIKQMKKQSIIMHPAPFNRGMEITDDVVECKKSRIFEQVKNGVYIRMALINMALDR